MDVQHNFGSSDDRVAFLAVNTTENFQMASLSQMVQNFLPPFVNNAVEKHVDVFTCFLDRVQFFMESDRQQLHAVNSLGFQKLDIGGAVIPDLRRLAEDFQSL